MDAITQSAKFYVVASDGDSYALQDGAYRPYIASATKIAPVRTGELFESPHGDDDLIATVDGWKPV